MVTGISILRLANAGVFKLDDYVAPILDPYFAQQTPPIPSMEKMFGENVRKTALCDFWLTRESADGVHRSVALSRLRSALCCMEFS